MGQKAKTVIATNGNPSVLNSEAHVCLPTDIPNAAPPTMHSYRGALNVSKPSHHTRKCAAQERRPALTSRGAKLRNSTRPKKTGMQGESSKKVGDKAQPIQQTGLNLSLGPACVITDFAIFLVHISKEHLSSITNSCGVSMADVLITHQRQEKDRLIQQATATNNAKTDAMPQVLPSPHNDRNKGKEHIDCDFFPDSDSSEDKGMDLEEYTRLSR
jgi:hypothetical protein